MDETQTTVATQPRSLWKRDKIRLLSWLAFVVATCFLIFGLITTWQVNSSVLLYPVFTVVSTLAHISLFVSCLLVPLMLMVTGYFLFENSINPKDYPEVYFFEFLLIILALTFFVLNIAAIGGNYWLIPSGSARLDGYSFHLAERHHYDE
jgi:hypothetical protein